MPSAPFRSCSHSRVANTHPRPTGWVLLGGLEGLSRALVTLSYTCPAGNQTSGPTPCALLWCWCRLHCPAFTSLPPKAPSKENTVASTFLGVLCVQEQWGRYPSKDGQGELDPTRRRAVLQWAAKHFPTQCRPFVAGMYLQGKTWRRQMSTLAWPKFLWQKSLLKAPQQAQSLGPASLYFRVHPHGSNRVCWSVRGGYGWQCSCTIACIYQHATWSLNELLCSCTLGVQWHFSCSCSDHKQYQSVLELLAKSRHQDFNFDSQDLPEGAGKVCSVRKILLTFLGMLKKSDYDLFHSNFSKNGRHISQSLK